MKVAVVGLWHLGSVIAACLGRAGHEIVGIDDNRNVVADMVLGKAPIFEPGLEEACRAAVQAGSLRFSSDFASVSEAEVVWIAYDTPVDENDQADVAFVEQRVKDILAHVQPNAVLLISSQVPVGFTRQIMEYCRETHADKSVSFAYSPENLRIGKAIAVFTKPDRVIIGCPDDASHPVLKALFASFTDNIIWMTLESAEMTKHALNAFFALSISFINEIASVCEQVGADAREVERGLKSEERIGPKAYLSPGAAFAGGTLARDVEFLVGLAKEKRLRTPILAAVRMSNEEHKKWAARRLFQKLTNLRGEVIAVLGLTYKPGTDTLRRSSSVELCEWLVEQGSIVRAHDPAIAQLPEELNGTIDLKQSAREAIEGASAIVVATEWPEFKDISADQVISWMGKPLVLDANGFLREHLGSENKIDYFAVGRP